MWVKFILLQFLSILLVLMLFIVSICFVCYFRLLKFTLRKNRFNTVYASETLSKWDYLLVWKLVEYSFNHYTYLCKGLRCERNKHTVNTVKIGLRFHRDETTYFKISRLYAYVKQIYAKEFTFDNRSCIKKTIFQKMCNSNSNTLSFIPHLCYFSYLHWAAACEGQSLTTLFPTKMRRKEITTRTSISLSYSIRVPSLLWYPL